MFAHVVVDVGPGALGGTVVGATPGALASNGVARHLYSACLGLHLVSEASGRGLTGSLGPAARNHMRCSGCFWSRCSLIGLYPTRRHVSFSGRGSFTNEGRVCSSMSGGVFALCPIGFPRSRGIDGGWAGAEVCSEQLRASTGLGCNRLFIRSALCHTIAARGRQPTGRHPPGWLVDASAQEETYPARLACHRHRRGPHG